MVTARLRQTVKSASRNRTYSGPSETTGALPARPFAITSRVSLVEVSPSTVIMLKVSRTTSLRAF